MGQSLSHHRQVLSKAFTPIAASLLGGDERGMLMVIIDACLLSSSLRLCIFEQTALEGGPAVVLVVQKVTSFLGR